MNDGLALGVSVLLILACAVFVAAEFALTTLDRAALERAAAAGERGAQGALAAVRRLTFQLSGAQLGITLTSLVIGMLAQPALAAVLAGPLESAGLSEGAAESVALPLGVALSTVTLMVFGELVPKNWAISHPIGVAKAVAAPQRAFTTVFSPLIGHLNNTANRALHRMGLEPAEELASARSPQELVALARHSARAGTLEADTAELFVRAVSLAELTTEQIMTPRIRVHGLRGTATADELITLTRRTGHTRFPVYQGSLDDVVGIVELKAALAVPEAARAATAVAELAETAPLVPATLPVDDLLNLLRGEQTMAVVVDEYGGTAGVVTLEDIVEEVVGDVRDEHDPEERPEVRPVGTDAEGRSSWDVDGSYRVDQAEEFGFPEADGPYETLAGLVADRLARIPQVGDEVAVGGWTVHVTEVDHHRASRVRVTGPVSARDEHEDEHEDGDEGMAK